MSIAGSLKRDRHKVKIGLLTAVLMLSSTNVFAEFCSARDMQKECRVALDVLQGHAEKNFENTLFTGECVGYIQAAGDVSLAMKENVNWFNVCVSDNLSTLTLIRKFIVFVDKYPKYKLASTAFQMMLVDLTQPPKTVPAYNESLPGRGEPSERQTTQRRADHRDPEAR